MSQIYHQTRELPLGWFGVRDRSNKALNDKTLLGVAAGGDGAGDRDVAARESFARHYLGIREQAATFFFQRLSAGWQRAGTSLNSSDSEPAGAAEAVDRVLDAVERKLVAHLGQLREPDKFAPWLYRITLNACRDEWRRHRRNVSNALVIAETHVESGGSVDITPAPKTAPETTPNATRLDVATMVTGKLAYVPPHDLELSAEELLYLSQQRQQPADKMLDTLWAVLGPLHDKALAARTEHERRIEERLGMLFESILRRQRELRHAHAQDRPLLETRLQKLTKQRERLLADSRKSRPKLWRVPTDELAHFLCPDEDKTHDRKRAADAIEKRLSRFRTAYRQDYETPHTEHDHG